MMPSAAMMRATHPGTGIAIMCTNPPLATAPLHAAPPLPGQPGNSSKLARAIGSAANAAYGPEYQIEISCGYRVAHVPWGCGRGNEPPATPAPPQTENARGTAHGRTPRRPLGGFASRKRRHGAALPAKGYKRFLVASPSGVHRGHYDNFCPVVSFCVAEGGQCLIYGWGFSGPVPSR